MEGDFRVDQWLIQPQLNTIVSPDNASIQLEPKVMEVLVYLADRAGEVVSKESLLQAVWCDTFVTENALTRCITELRRAFRDDATEPRFIQTITRRGYRLIAPVSQLKEAASRYERLEKLGEGGMGEVYLARDTELQRKVALKFIRAGEVEDESAGKRLLREARAAAVLDHPFIAKIFDTGRMDGRTFIAMEYLEGRTLKQQLAKGRLEEEEALRLAGEIAEALETAHDRGVVHRDLKPSNIMITPQGHVKVMDFGLAKRLVRGEMSASSEVTVSALTKEGTTAGTLPYMSPEQLRAEAVDHRSDIFSYGIVLYEMLTGIHPFQRANAIETAGAILRDAPPPLGEHVQGVHPLLAHAIGKLLAKSADRRYQSIHDARTDLAEVIETPPPEAATTASLPRRNKWRIAIAAIGLVLGGAALVALGSLLSVPEPVDLGNYKYTPFATEAAQETLGAWSPDGKSIAYLKEFAAADRWEWHVMVRSLDLPNPTRLTRMGGGVTYWQAPVWSSEGTRILFLKGGQVWSVSAAGGEPETVFKKKEDSGTWAFSLSPGDRTLALWRQTKETARINHSIWISSPVGSEPRLYEPRVLNIQSASIPTILRFSPDGMKLGLAVEDPSVLENQFWIIPWPDQSASSHSQPFAEKLFQIGGKFFDWLPDSRHIIITGNDRLWLGDCRTGVLSGVTASTGNDTQPSVSPEGSRIVHSRFDQDLDIAELPFDGAPPRLILSTARKEHSPSWSASGNVMAFATDRRGVQEVWLHTAAEEIDRPIVTQQDFPGDNPIMVVPSLSPDGSRVAYVRLWNTTSPGLWISPVEGGRPVRAFPGAEDVYSAPAWSPDGVRLACYRWGQGGDVPRMLVARPGSQEPPLVLPDIVYPQVVPAWSPNGQWIAYGGNNKIVLVSPDGSQTQTFSAPERIYVYENALFWSSDGATIYLVTSLNGGARLHALDLGTGRWHKLSDWGQKVRFTSRGGNTLTAVISENGMGFRTTIQYVNSDLWILEGFRLPDAAGHPWLNRLGRLLRSSGK